MHFLLEMPSLKKGRDRDGVGALLCGHAGKHTSGLKPFISLEPMRPKPKGLGYLIVASSEITTKAKAKTKTKGNGDAADEEESGVKMGE